MRNKNYTQKLQAIIDKETARGGVGLCGLTLNPASREDVVLEQIAKESIAMHKAYLTGNCTDISYQEL